MGADLFSCGSNEIILEKTGAETSFYLHGPRIDEIIASYNLTTGEYRYFHTDGLGSITQITDDSGQMTENYTYDAFGAVTNNEGQETNNQWLFTGRQFDPESGLYFYGQLC